MQTFQEAVERLKSNLEVFSDKITEDIVNKNIAKFSRHILDEKVNILLLKTSLTGSDRAKPQIRVFTEKILQEVKSSFENNERFFCFIHCSHDQAELKFKQIEPCNYIISLESDWGNAGGRIDVRSIYDFIEHNPTIRFKKLNRTQHTAKSVLQATIFKDTDGVFENFEPYMCFFDSRLVSQEQATSDDDADSEAILDQYGVNKIYFGAPGTGKSHSIKEFIQENGIAEYDEREGHPNVFRTTLHPEFTYYDFVGQVMPVVKPVAEGSTETKIEYDFVPAVFTKALARAFSEDVKDQQPVFLILEEMSRANVAAVFGDLFQLLDRHSDTGESEYRIHNDLISKEIFKEHRQIYIPRNLFIIGTVNTNDQNVFVMDTAFKRRFEFEYVNADEVAFGKNGKPLNNFHFSLTNGGEDVVFKWVTLYRVLNRFITKKVDHGGLGLKEDKQLGQFFIKFRENDDQYNFNQLKGKLLQYLYEDIEAVSYTNTSLFVQTIGSFGEAYTKLNQSENVFSAEFLNEYSSLAASDLSKGY